MSLSRTPDDSKAWNTLASVVLSDGETQVSLQLSPRKEGESSQAQALAIHEHGLTHKPAKIIPLPVDKRYYNLLAIPNSSCVVTYDVRHGFHNKADRAVHIWDLSQPQEKLQPVSVRLHNSLSLINLQCTEDGKYLTCLSQSKSENQQIDVFNIPLQKAVFSSSVRKNTPCVTSSMREEIFIGCLSAQRVDMKSGEVTKILKSSHDESGRSAYINTYAILEKRNILVTGHGDGTVRITPLDKLETKEHTKIIFQTRSKHGIVNVTPITVGDEEFLIAITFPERVASLLKVNSLDNVNLIETIQLRGRFPADQQPTLSFFANFDALTPYGETIRFETLYKLGNSHEVTRNTRNQFQQLQPHGFLSIEPAAVKEVTPTPLMLPSIPQECILTDEIRQRLESKEKETKAAVITPSSAPLAATQEALQRSLDEQVKHHRANMLHAGFLEERLARLRDAKHADAKLAQIDHHLTTANQLRKEQDTLFVNWKVAQVSWKVRGEEKYHTKMANIIEELKRGDQSRRQELAEAQRLITNLEPLRPMPTASIPSSKDDFDREIVHAFVAAFKNDSASEKRRFKEELSDSDDEFPDADLKRAEEESKRSFEAETKGLQKSMQEFYESARQKRVAQQEKQKLMTPSVPVSTPAPISVLPWTTTSDNDRNEASEHDWPEISEISEEQQTLSPRR